MKLELIKKLDSRLNPRIIQLSSFLSSFWLQIVVLTLFLSLRFLLDNNMGNVNEVDVLPLARQYADPTWIPHDWYLNQPPGYRLLFQFIVGKLATACGFLAASIIGRLVCYCLLASGLILIGRRLGLNLVFLLLAVLLFIINPYQGAVAQEWIVGPLETKAIAYGFVLLGIYWMLGGRYVLTALMFGVATSFHVLVGGWTFLSALGWLALNQVFNRTHESGVRGIGHFAAIILTYLIASAFALPTVFHHLRISSSTGLINASYIYVFLRLPHHLNPLSWRIEWLPGLLYLLILAISVAIIRNQTDSKPSAAFYDARLGLARFTLVALVPFVLGALIAPFDTQGTLLQYYPFRLGDVMLTLSTCLLFICALKQLLTPKAERVAIALSLILLSGLSSIQAIEFQEQLTKIRQFPSQTQNSSLAWEDMCFWIRQNTPKEARVISPPVEFVNFSWLSERATIAKYKLLPQSKAGLLAWYERLDDLSGKTDPWRLEPGEQPKKSKFREALTNGYAHLGTEQVKALIDKYQANYFVTRLGHQLDLPIAYQNSEHILYTVSDSIVFLNQAPTLNNSP